ncbi:MAG: DUF4422 domain-containing protein [Dorea sp.]|nr:DUF4422 domain-containing protein [Dorea sp.]
MRIIIYAVGRMFEYHSGQIEWEDIIALADKNPKIETKKYGFPVIKPDVICEWEYDFIAIFSNKYFEKIKMELVGEYFVPKEKIIPWREIVLKESVSSGILQHYKIFLKERMCKRVLVFELPMIHKNCLIKEELLSWKEGVLDGVWSRVEDQNKNLYENIYEKFEECDENYDAILLGSELCCRDHVLEQIKSRTRYILIHTGYLTYEISAKKTLEDKLRQCGEVSCISDLEGLFWIVDTENKQLTEDASIYVVTHKDYNVPTNYPYKPLCVGDYQKRGYLTESMGENIAYLNKKINESTALYWIWKNTNEKYVGINHYRRYFYNNEIRSVDNYLDIEHICEIFKEYDIILPQVYSMAEMTVFEQLRATINHELFEEGYSIIRNKIGKVHPNYLEVFDSVMEGSRIFPCNLFVAKREIVNRYCEWLFSFLIEAAEEIDVENCDNYSRRVIGFFAERMWTVWLRKNRVKVKELPYVQM